MIKNVSVVAAGGGAAFNHFTRRNWDFWAFLNLCFFFSSEPSTVIEQKPAHYFTTFPPCDTKDNHQNFIIFLTGVNDEHVAFGAFM